MQSDILIKIRDFVGFENYLKGRNYYGDIDYLDSECENRVYSHNFMVESERDYNKSYDVNIKISNGEIVSASCDCPQFKKASSCKHVAACLIEYHDDIFEMALEDKKIYLSKMLLKEFSSPINKINNVKKQLHIDVSLTFSQSYYDDLVYLNFKIGEKKMYNLNIRLSEFLSVYNEEREELKFGKELTYNPRNFFFSKEDEAIIKYLSKINNKNYYYNYRNFSIKAQEFSAFIDLLRNKEFMIEGYGVINKIEEGNPFKLNFKKENVEYNLSFVDDNIIALTSDYKYVVQNDTLYILPDKFSKILSLMNENEVEDITILEEDFPSFKESIMPIIKNNVVLDKTVENEIILGVKPQAKLYFDIKEDIIFCNPVFVYQEQEIAYFEENSVVLRDIETENMVIKTLLDLGFKIDNNKIYLDDIDTMVYLLEEGFQNLANDYEVFTTENLKNAKIIRENNIRSSFSIGEDNIMSYDFDLGSIPQSEILSVLDAFRQKKKYYRMKSGDFLNLSNEDLEQFDNLVATMDLSTKDIKNGHGVIPKYRAIYLDSLKSKKYNIIKTNNLFDQLINNFNSYKDLPISLSAEDKKILRDYQEIGVKWLYNIYKCGFGGILADEMGLGKSIQLIYLIKEIVKEKKDALFLIVAPTSLIYNWKNEFDKFGQDLKYKVFAENKKVRKQELEQLNDVQVLITTYGLVREDKEIYNNINFELVVIDEAQTIKNSNAQMTKVVKNLHANTKIALTGTPLENSVMELWSIFDFIMPGYLAEITRFQQKYNIKDITEDDLKNLDSLKEQIKPFILRRRKKEVVKELPPKIENNISIDLNEEQKKIYVATLKKTREELDEILRTEGFKKGNFKILQLLTKLRQLCIDPSILYENYQLQF